MTRIECENQILEKLKEIKAIAKKYDKSEEFYLSITIYEDCIAINNALWETETPLEVTEYNDGRVLRCDN